MPSHDYGSNQESDFLERFGLSRSLEAYRHASKRSKIIRRDRTLNTIQAAPELSSRVRGVSLDSRKYDKAGLREIVTAILYLMKTSISYSHICWEVNLIHCLDHFPVTLLVLLSVPTATSKITALDDIYPISLRHLSLVRNFKFVDSHTKTSRPASKSEVILLRLPYRSDDLRHLSAVLTRPAALLSFHIFASSH